MSKKSPFDLPKIDSAGLRAARKLGADRVSSVVNVRIPGSRHLTVAPSAKTALEEARDVFAQELRKYWSFDDGQVHTHSWHSREDFIKHNLARLIERSAAALAAPSEEPVAWRARLDGEHAWKATHSKAVADQWLDGGYQVEPLYTRPTLLSQEREDG